MKKLATAVALGLAVAAGPAHADADLPASHEHPAAEAQAFVPGLGEIMSLQQMRHAKLWFAGARGNWALAKYELDELREGFDDAGKLHPVHENAPVAALIARLTPAPLEALGEAIQAKSAAQFGRSFDGLTAACNTCHRAANHGFIRIKRPAGPAYGNQAFAPAPK